MNVDEASDRIRTAFNDAARDGYPVVLRSRDEPEEEVIPCALASAFPGSDGMYVQIRDPRTQHAFNASRHTSIAALPRVANVRLVDADGRERATAPRDLEGCRIEFDVRGMPKDDTYRIEVFPDPTVAMQQIEQIIAGRHVNSVQHFAVPLRGRAAHQFLLEIYRVDRATAKRDVNDDAPKEWGNTFEVD